MNILGINAYHGNASAAVVCDGRLVAAAEEERFNRVKYAAGFPARAVRYCLEEAGVSIAEVDHIAVPAIRGRAWFPKRCTRYGCRGSLSTGQRRWCASPASGRRWLGPARWPR